MLSENVGPRDNEILQDLMDSEFDTAAFLEGDSDNNGTRTEVEPTGK
jgi:hypothetical protein